MLCCYLISSCTKPPAQGAEESCRGSGEGERRISALFLTHTHTPHGCLSFSLSKGSSSLSLRRCLGTQGGTRVFPSTGHRERGERKAPGEQNVAGPCLAGLLSVRAPSGSLPGIRRQLSKQQVLVIESKGKSRKSPKPTQELG